MQNSEGRIANVESRKRLDLPERLLEFACAVVRFGNRVRAGAAGRYTASQLMRAAASAGANYREACAAESRADFVHKSQVVLKELREAEYWLELMRRTALVPIAAVAPLAKETDELIRIMVKSVVTAKSKQ